MVVLPLKCTCIPYLPQVCLILFCYSFGIWDDYLSYGFLCWSVSCNNGLIVIVCGAIVVPTCAVVGGAIVITCILLGTVNNFILYHFNGPVWVIAFAQSSS